MKRWQLLLKMAVSGPFEVPLENLTFHKCWKRYFRDDAMMLKVALNQTLRGATVVGFAFSIKALSRNERTKEIT